jgi:hypothetical protein
MIFAIDFDGTCVTHEFPNVGRDIGAAQVLRRIVKSGHKIILYTMRSDVEKPISDNSEIISLGGDYLSQAIDWFNKNHIPLFGINENPEQKSWTHSPKPYANVYIDDAALGCPLISDGKNRPFVDWVTVERILEHQGYLT